MGYGAWNTNTYDARAAAKRARGESAFDYSDVMARTLPRSAWTVHASLDPQRVNSNGPFAGTITREAADSPEHPESTPIAVIFDVTGSMGGIPRVLQRKLPALHGLLQRKRYAADPQILFGAVGDAYCDRVPLQIGQFESDNRMDEQLESIVLEGGGGGGNHESYELAAYFLARHSHLDSARKRGRKGYAFFIGDERIYRTVDARQVRRLIGEDVRQSIDTEDVFAMLREQYEVFFLFAAEGSYRPEDVLSPREDSEAIGWRGLVGQNALILEDATAVCETIAVTIGLHEGTVSLRDGLDDLAAAGADGAAIEATGRALADVRIV